MTTARALLWPAGNLVLHVGSFAVTLLTWSRVLRTHFGPPANAVIIMGAPILVVPASVAARRWLDRGPTPQRIHAAAFLLHWVVMILVSAALLEAIKTGRSWRGWTLPLQPGIGWALIWITGLPGWVIGRQCSHDKVLVGGETGVDGGALVIVGVMPSARAIVAIVRERLSACLADSDD